VLAVGKVEIMLEKFDRSLRARWPGSRIKEIRFSKSRIYVIVEVEGEIVKAIIYPHKNWKVRTYSRLTGVSISIRRLLERCIEYASKKPLQAED
jgi:hypothetical protein